jgi:hypothetical protein
MAARSPLLRRGRQHHAARALVEVLAEMQLDGAEGCFLLHVKRGVITVGVESSVARHEMHCFHRQEVLERIREKLPGENLQEIRFVVSERRDGLSENEQ